MSAGKNLFNNIASSPITPVVVVTALGLVFFKKELGDMFNSLNPFSDSKQDTQNFSADTPQSAWNPQYWHGWYNKLNQNKLPKDVNAVRIQSTTSGDNAKKIYDSLGRLSLTHLSDDDTTVIATIKTLTTKSAVSYLAERFNTLYQKDLFNWIQYYLNSDTMSKVIEYVNSLPIGLLDSTGNIIR